MNAWPDPIDLQAKRYAELVVREAKAFRFDAPKTEQLAVALLAAHGEIDRLNKLINTPELEEFAAGVRLEAAHQVERWGEAHDRSKSAENWFWLVGYLGGKALRATITGDRTKALHHCISAAAALLNWHSAIKRDTTSAGVGADEDLDPERA